MAVEDTLEFLRERMRVFNPDIPVEPGSDFDQRVLVPLAGRLGPDVFTTNTRAFLHDLLSRNFPDLALGQLDALTEALILPVEVALSPVVAEISRVNRSGSFANPDQLTIEEADALGANLLQDRERGSYARGTVRLYFSHPQPKQVDLSTVFLSDTGLRFVPTAVQSISANEMLMNQEGSLYYMTATVEATEPGDQYNLEPHQITAVQGVAGVVKVTNLARFKGGLAEQTAQEFIESLPRKMGEQGMSQATGIIRQLSSAFPILTRIAVVGYGDPEMQRDLLQGESLGKALAAGFGLQSLPDDSGKPTTRLLHVSASLEPVSPGFTQYPLPLVLSVIGPSLPAPRSRDLEVEQVLDDRTVLVKTSEIPVYQGMAWSLRKRELRVSKAPGLLPGTEIAAPPDRVHVGGAVDVFLRTPTFSDSTTIIDRIDDMEPALQGRSAQGAGNVVQLHDLRLGLDYAAYSDTQKLVERVWPERWSLQILGGPGAGVWEILDVVEAQGAPTIITLYDDLPAPFSGARWRLLDDYDIDLRAPTLLRWKGSDLETSQGLDVVQTTSALDWLEYGVEVGDVLEIFSGRDEGEYRVTDIFGGGNRKLRLDRALATTRSSVGFRVYRPNTSPPLEFPAVRITRVDLLDPAGQPMQVQVPYGRCLGAVSRGLSNPGVGVKLEVSDALLGLISEPFPNGANLNGKQLWLEVMGDGPYQITFSGADPISMASAASQINSAVGQVIAVPVGDRLGIFPLGGREVRTIGPPHGPPVVTGLSLLFGARYRISTRSVRAPSFTTTTFSDLSPALSLDYDMVQVRGGGQAGAHGIEAVTVFSNALGTVDPNGLRVSTPGGFYPEAGVRLVVGSRSAGVVRSYFVDPVTVEFTQDTRLKHILPDGQELIFRPDPRFNTQLLPALPKGEKGKDGNCVGGDNIFNTTLDFRAKRIRSGDLVVIDYKPITAGALANPVPNLAGQTLYFSFEGQESSQTLVFVNDDPTIPATHVTRQGVLNQLNRKLGSGVATLAAGNILELNPDYLLSISRTGTANTALGLSILSNTSNRSANAGTYRVLVPGNLGCTLNKNLVAEARMQFRVLRPGSQRLGSTSMQRDESNLYYADLEVVSDGVGNEYNLDSGEVLTVARYFSDGFDLTTPDDNVAFSEREELHIHLPLRVNSIGTNDDPEESTSLEGLQLRVTAESCPEVAEVQGFMLQDLQRDVNSNPLVMALTPHHIFFTLDYVGGPTEQEMLDLLSRKVHALFPDQALSVDDIVTWARQAGAAEVVMPIRLFAVVVDRDRQLRLLTSLDRVSVSRQAAFYPTGIRVRRQTLLPTGSAGLGRTRWPSRCSPA